MPKFQHDCDACTFLGHQDDHDLYVCQSPATTQFTYIARYGDDGPDYVSLSARVLKTLPPEPGYILWKALQAHRTLLQNEVALTYGPDERTEPHITL